MIFEGYQDLRTLWGKYGGFPGTRNVISNISEVKYFFENSESKIFPHVLLDKDGILETNLYFV